MKIEVATLVAHLRRLTLTLCLLSMAQLSLAQSPVSVIEEASDLLATQLAERRDELAADQDALYAMVNEIILPRFDRRYAAQLVLGRNWRTASDEQRTAFIEVFYENLMRRYADGVLEYNEDRIEIMPFRGDESKPRVIVKTLVTLDDGTKVPVDYALVKRESAWMVFDVIIEGISYVRNFRAELNSELQNSNLDAVIARLESETSAGVAE